MSLTVRSTHHACTLRVQGTLDESLALALVDAGDRAVAEYGYRALIVELDTPGGAARSLEYVLEAFSRWRALGARVDTCGLGQAMSAGTLLLACGDHRSASATTMVLLHPLQNVPEDAGSKRLKDAATAHMARVLVERTRGVALGRGLAAALSQGHLVSEARNLEVAALLAYASGEVLERLPRVPDPVVHERYQAPAERAALIAALCARLEAVARDDAARARLYERLSEADVPISGHMARALGLVDAIGGPRSAAPPPPPDRAVLQVPEWGSVFPEGRVSFDLLRRHMLSLGESGSGKTRSAVLPLLRAAFAAPSISTLLVIDPKGDIAPLLQALAADPARPMEVVPIDPAETCIDLMGSAEWSIAPLLAEGRWMQAAARVFSRISSLVPGHGARTIDGAVASTSRDPFWEREATALAQALLAFTLWWLQRPSRVADMLSHRLSFVDASAFLDEKDSAAERKRRLEPYRRCERACVAALRLEDVAARFGFASEAGAWEVLAHDERPLHLPDTVLARLWRESGVRAADAARWERWATGRPDGMVEPAGHIDPDLARRRRRLLLCTPPPGVPANVLAIADAVALAVALPGFEGALLDECSDWLFRDGGTEASEAGAALARFAALDRTAAPTYAGVFGHVNTCWAPVNRSPLREQLRFGPEPSDPSRTAPAFDASVRGAGAGVRRCFVYSDADALREGLVGRAVKATFFEAVLDDPARSVPRHGRPTVGYICDEFQRFITSDFRHGEQAFLEIARSFGAFVALATQSVASLALGLSRIEPDAQVRLAAVDSLLGNTATKLFFRSTDPSLQARVESMCPRSVGEPTIVELRPLSTLQVGECYALAPDGRMVRAQIAYSPDPAPPSR